MTNRCLRRIAIASMLWAAAITAPPIPTAAGPGEAGRGRARADFVVVVWYRGDDALKTFDYRSYDLRKGEYTAGVDDWLKMMREKYPRYVVRVLPVLLDHERGATEKLKVGSVIHRELLLAAAESGIVLGEPMRIGPGPSASRRPTPRTNVWDEAPGAGGSTNINPVGRITPFPVPYVRPHP